VENLLERGKVRLGIEVWTRQLSQEEETRMREMIPIVQLTTQVLAALPGGKEVMRQIHKEIQAKLIRNTTMN
jgi:hypothetical protein